MLRRLVAVVVCAVALATVPTGVHAGQPRATEARYAVGVRTFDLEDTSRPTPADAEGQTPVTASDTRKLPTSVYYPAIGAPTAHPETSIAVPDAPAADGSFPVILFSHGAPGTPGDYVSILERWAAEGYVVVAPTYPVSSIAGPTSVAYADQREQAEDARFVLDRVLELNDVEVADGGLGGLLDPKHVAAAGHSMGGFTTTALVSDCCRDRRIRAALVLAGVSRGGAAPELRHASGPILFAHATLDLAVPFEQSQRVYARAGRPKYLLEIRLLAGGVIGHVLPYLPAGGTLATAVTGVLDDFLAGYLQGDRAARRELAVAARSHRDLRLRSAR
jgi:dienelactone hydrolase